MKVFKGTETASRWIWSGNEEYKCLSVNRMSWWKNCLTSQCHYSSMRTNIMRETESHNKNSKSKQINPPRISIASLGGYVNPQVLWKGRGDIYFLCLACEKSEYKNQHLWRILEGHLLGCFFRHSILRLWSLWLVFPPDHILCQRLVTFRRP